MSKIKAAREKANLTRNDVTALLRIPYRTLEDWESGRRSPTDWAEKLIIEKLERITKERGNVKMNELLKNATLDELAEMQESGEIEGIVYAVVVEGYSFKEYNRDDYTSYDYTVELLTMNKEVAQKCYEKELSHFDYNLKKQGPDIYGNNLFLWAIKNGENEDLENSYCHNEWDRLQEESEED